MPKAPARPTRAAMARRVASSTVDLVLYVSSNSRHTPTAERNCEQLLARFNPRRVRFEVCDVSVHPDRAEADAVFFTPMLVRREPLPRAYVVGDLTNTRPILEMLAACGIRPTR